MVLIRGQATYGLRAAYTGTAWPTFAQRRQHGAPPPWMSRHEPLWRHAANLAGRDNANHGDDGARFRRRATSECEALAVAPPKRGLSFSRTAQRRDRR